MTLSPREWRSEIAATTASSSGVRSVSRAIRFESGACMYQVTRTPAQLALVDARAAREACPSAEGYSSCHHEAWVNPLKRKEALWFPGGAAAGDGPVAPHPARTRTRARDPGAARLMAPSPPCS